MHLAEAVFVDEALTAYYGIVALRYGELAWLGVGVHDAEYLTPAVAYGLSVEGEGYDAVGGWEEMEVTAYEVCVGHAKGSVRATYVYEAFVVEEELGVYAQTVPVYLVDRVGLVVAVVNALLVAEGFFACPDEWYALRGQDEGLGELAEAHDLVVTDAWYAGTQTVYEAHVVVAADVTDVLGGLRRPGGLAVVDFGHVDFGVRDSAYEAELDALFVSGAGGKVGWLAVVGEWAAEGIAHFVGKGSDVGHV